MIYRFFIIKFFFFYLQIMKYYISTNSICCCKINIISLEISFQFIFHHLEGFCIKEMSLLRDCVILFCASDVSGSLADGVASRLHSTAKHNMRQSCGNAIKYCGKTAISFWNRLQSVCTERIEVKKRWENCIPSICLQHSAMAFSRLSLLLDCAAILRANLVDIGKNYYVVFAIKNSKIEAKS